MDKGSVEREVKTLATGLSILEFRETGFEYFMLSLKLLTGIGLEFLTCYTSVFVLLASNQVATADFNEFWSRMHTLVILLIDTSWLEPAA